MAKSSGTFLDELALGRYLAVESPLHSAPAWAKGLALTAVAVGSFFLHSATSFALLGLAVAGTGWISKIPQTMLWRSLRPLLLLAAFTLLAGAFLNHSEATLLHPAFSWSGLHQGALYAARLLLITLLTTLFFLTTVPDQAIALGVRVMAPLRLLGIDKKELSLLVHLAYRFVPMLIREIEAMRLGRLARNLPEPVGRLGRARDAAESLVALLVGSLHRAENTALAIEQRGLLENWRMEADQGESRMSGVWPALALLLTTAVALTLDSRVW